MKIGLVATEFPPAFGGMEEHAWQTATELARHHDVTVFTRAGRGGGEAAFEVCDLLGPDLDRAIAAIRAFPADVWLGLSAAHSVLARLVTAPVLLYCHGNDLLRPDMIPSQLGARLGEPVGAGFGFDRIRHFVCNSRATARILADRHGIAEERRTVVPPGVDRRFFVQAPERSGERPFELLTVSRLTAAARRKNVEGVLRALALLPADLEVRYRIVGDGDERPRLEGLARDLGLDGRVTFAGAIAHDALPVAYAQADLMALVSITAEDDVEGFGMVYLEANAAGTPVLAAAGGGAVDAVEDGRTGLLLPSCDPETIAEAIAAVARREVRFDRDACRAFADAHRWPRLTARIERLLASCAGDA